MLDLDRIEEIWVTIGQNKLRSFLTAFGVLWGIYTLTLMMGTGNGLKRGFVHGIGGFATNSCFLGTSQTSIAYKGFQKGREWNIHNRDLKILTDSIPEIEFLSPITGAPLYINNVVFKERAGSFLIRGVYPNYAEIEQQHLVYGRFINDLDIDQRRKVCVIGTKVYEEMFPSRENPIGQEIRINGISYQVMGVTYGISDISVGGAKLEEVVLIPFTTLQQINNQGDIIPTLAVTSKKQIPVSRVEERIKEVLKELNQIHPDDLKAVWSINLEEEFNLFTNLFAGIDILIWIIGSGTLIAGIVGVCNIMLVTVRERTREIGIRRAIGATPRTIISQIMMESLVLTSIAGIPGLCLGVYTLFLADKYWLQNLDNVFFYKPMITFESAIVSIVILMISGLLAGSVPASRALRIKAIDAIREE
ncbi:MAG: ABC transporter permease [Candidatus Azobacteroides sp.]|nr:ABC transporter permease [Candidatus Azobacteroides sp.]